MKFFNKKVFLGSVISIALICLIWFVHKDKGLSLWDALDHYGYEQAYQKDALDYLCHEAHILPEGQSLKEHFPKRQNRDELLSDIIEFVKLTQSHFWMRSKTTERWEVKPKGWMLAKKPETLKALKELGMIDEIPPKNAHPDAITILGSTFEIMKTRIGYLENLYQSHKISTKHLVLLAGERKSSIGVDGSEQELNDIAKKLGLPSSLELMETHLIKEAYEKSRLFNKLETHVIDTPAGHLPRPTTETTTLYFIKWLRLHQDVKSVLFVSNQPYVKYQGAVIDEVFKSEGYAVDFRIAGPKASDPLSTQTLVESLGSYIWAKTPDVIRKMSLKVNAKNMEQLKELYRNNALIYRNVELLDK